MSETETFDLAAVLSTLTEVKLEKDERDTAELKRFVAHMFRCEPADVVQDLNFPFGLLALGEEIKLQHPQLRQVIPPEKAQVPQRPEVWIRMQEQRFGYRIAVRALPLKAGA